MTYQTVLNFWFNDIEPKFWWVKDPAFDEQITQTFGDLHHQAAAGELYLWRDSAEGCLAEIIVLDQFSRNMFRDTAKAFAYDSMALVLAQSAIQQQHHLALTRSQLGFMLLPYMHSESKIVHQQALALYQQFGTEDNLAFEIKHKNIIDRFGRYPHRNQLLGRQSTPEERAFLEQPGSSF